MNFETLLERGFFLMPVNATNKRPVSAVFNQTNGSRDPALIQSWLDAGHTLGVVCGTELPGGGYLLVVDIDDDKENGKDGWQSWNKLKETVPGWAPALHGYQVRTGRGDGSHMYFRVRSQFTGRSPAPAIDSRCHRQYVLAPGARHPSGRTYELVRDTEIADAPEWLETACREGQRDRSGYGETAPPSDEVAWRNYHRLYRICESLDLLLPESEAQYKSGSYVYVKCPLGPHEIQGSKTAILPPDIHSGRMWSGFRCLAGRHDGMGTQDVTEKLRKENFQLWRRIILT